MSESLSLLEYVDSHGKLDRHDRLNYYISAMCDELRKICGGLISEIILYGSYARGTETEESDVDIALILNDKPTKATSDAILDCVVSFELECGTVLSVIDIASAKYEQWKNVLPFYKNIKNEGIVLWKSAA